MNRKMKTKLVICLCYGITAINYIAMWLLPLESVVKGNGSILAVGIINLVMVPVSALENRKEMNGILAATLSITMHFMLGLVLSYVYLNGIMLCVSIVETALLIVFLLGYRKRNKK